MGKFIDKLLCRKNTLVMLTAAAAESVIMLFVNGSVGVDVPIIMLIAMTFCTLRQVDEPKKFQCLPAFLIFYINFARIICSLKSFNNAVGIIVMVPVVIGCVYTIIPTVKMWYGYYKKSKEIREGTDE